MPRFFLNVRDGGSLILDPEGAEFADLGIARAEALVRARELLADKLKKGQVQDSRAIEITDETDKVLATIPLMAVLTPGEQAL